MRPGVRDLGLSHESAVTPQCPRRIWEDCVLSCNGDGEDNHSNKTTFSPRAAYRALCPVNLVLIRRIGVHKGEVKEKGKTDLGLLIDTSQVTNRN